MSDGSVAPKERVNIVYESALGDAKEEIELPLKVLVMGDFTMEPDDRTLEERKPINIDKNNFNEVMEGLNLSLNINVADKLSDQEDQEMPLSLKFKNIKDFQPDSITEQIPELQKIIELRKALMALKGPLGNIPGVKKTIQKLIDDDASRSKLMAELSLT